MASLVASLTKEEPPLPPAPPCPSPPALCPSCTVETEEGGPCHRGGARPARGGSTARRAPGTGDAADAVGGGEEGAASRPPGPTAPCAAVLSMPPPPPVPRLRCPIPSQCHDDAASDPLDNPLGPAPSHRHDRRRGDTHTEILLCTEVVNRIDFQSRRLLKETPPPPRGWVGGPQKIALKFPAPLINFIFCRRKILLMWCGWGGQPGLARPQTTLPPQRGPYAIACSKGPWP